jgi:indole-3-glycerol phosphate synthase
MKDLGTTLTSILKTKKREIEVLQGDYDSLKRRAFNIGRAAKILSPGLTSPEIDIIGQVKDVREALSARKAGVTALAVVPHPYFGGTMDHVRRVSDITNLPIISKDFILGEVQLYQNRLAGAGTVLMLPMLFDDKKKLKHLIGVADTLGLECLMEVHTPEELDVALTYGRLIGINNRDITALPEDKVDLAITERLLPLVPRYRNIISLSGIKGPKDIERLSKEKIKTVNGTYRTKVSGAVVGRYLANVLAGD